MKINPFLVILLLLPSFLVFALPEDGQKLALLAADTADIQQQIHQGTYVGNVRFDQGTRHIRAEKVITKTDQKNQLILAILYGSKQKPAHYWEQPSVNKPILHAYAQEIRYHPREQLVELIGNAKVTQGKDSFSAPLIRYNIQTQHVLTENNRTDRTLIVIHPGKKNV